MILYLSIDNKVHMTYFTEHKMTLVKFVNFKSTLE